jgi:alpha-tubulin suppressor-like RCC1 family protein
MLTTGNSLLLFGGNSYGQIGDLTNVDCATPKTLLFFSVLTVTQIGAGYYHSLCATSTKVYAWGLNNHGQLGDNTFQDRWFPVGNSISGSNLNYFFFFRKFLNYFFFFNFLKKFKKS